jgi:F-type H+-transporting ATPase subunit b
MPQLDPTFYASQLFWLGVIFVLIYLGVRYYFSPRFQHLFHLREEKIEKKLAVAKQLKLEAETLEQESRQKLEHMTDRARILIHDAELASRHVLSARQHALAMIHSKVIGDADKELRALKEDFFHSKKAEEELTRLLFERLTPFDLGADVYKEAIKHTKDHHHVA